MKLLVDYREDGSITRFTCYSSKQRIVPQEGQIVVDGTQVPMTFHSHWREYGVDPEKGLMLKKFITLNKKESTETEGD